MLLNEIFNPDVFQRGFETQAQYGRYHLTARHGQLPWLGHGREAKSSDQFRVEARLGRTLVGWVNFEVVDDHLEAIDVVVDKKHRRRGLATAMYRLARSLGNDIRPSSKQTGMGREFWRTKSPVQEHLDGSERDTLDQVLTGLCEMIVLGQQKDAEKYGLVAAALVDPKNVLTARVSSKQHDQWQHAERNAIDAYLESHDRIPPNSIIITTLSPCNRPMPDRYGESCEDLLEHYGIDRVYAGYRDPTQDDSRAFDIEYTHNQSLTALCRRFASEFLPAQLDELSFLGSQCTQDCSGHRAGYDWYKQNGRTPQSWSPSFNKGAALAQSGK